MGLRSRPETAFPEAAGAFSVLSPGVWANIAGSDTIAIANIAVADDFILAQ